MTNWPHVLRAALVSGSCASLASTAALTVAAVAEGKAAAQPINATSHWLHGDRAAAVTRVDGTHTGVGYATNHAACVFWAVFFEAWLVRRPPRRPAAMLRDAAVMAAIAAAVDYGATPKRFTPGWELALSRSGMALAYAGLAAGLAAGSLLTQAARQR